MSPQIHKASQHRMWLDDPITRDLLSYLNKQVKDKTARVFQTRRSDPFKLSDTVVDLELATTLKSVIETGKFLN